MLLQHRRHISVEPRPQSPQRKCSCPTGLQTMRHRAHREAERDQADCHPVTKLESE